MTQYERLYETLRSNELVQSALREAARIALPNWWIVGGTIRDVVWSDIAGRPFAPAAVRDIDLIYFDPARQHKRDDLAVEATLPTLQGTSWSVKNQARMPVADSDPPAEFIEDAMAKFPETISSIGVKTNSRGELIIMSIYAYDDLLSMTIRPTPFFVERFGWSAFAERVKNKGWMTKWPTATIATPKAPN